MTTKLMTEPRPMAIRKMKPIQTFRIQGIAFKAAYGSKRAYLLMRMAEQETQVQVPVAIVFGAGMIAGVAIYALAQWFLG